MNIKQALSLRSRTLQYTNERSQTAFYTLHGQLSSQSFPKVLRTWEYHARLRNHLQVTDSDIIGFFEGHGFQCLDIEMLVGPFTYRESLGLTFIFVSAGNLLWIKRNMKLGEGVADKIYLAFSSNQGKEAFGICNEFLDKFCMGPQQGSEKTGSVYVLSPGSQGYNFARAGLGGVSFVPDNYPPEIQLGFQNACQMLSDPDPQGRLWLLTGETGTGKTYFIRGLLQDIQDGFFVIISPTMVGNLGGPELLQVLLEHQQNWESKKETLILIVEDADNCLVPRGLDNMGAISSLLNLTEGILGSVLDLRVIATTNARNVDIDKALLRPGRLHLSLTFPKLNPAQASQSYQRLTGKPLQGEQKTLSLAEVYALAYEEPGVSVSQARKPEPPKESTVRSMMEYHAAKNPKPYSIRQQSSKNRL